MEEYLKKVQYPLLICFVISLPTFGVELPFTGGKLNNIFILLLAANTLVLHIISKDKEKRPVSWWVILFISFYLIHVIGLLRADNFKQGIFDLDKKISLLLFPLILYYQPQLSQRQLQKILLAFALSCVLAAILCLSLALYHYVTTNDSTFFFYHNLSRLIGMHAVYLSMYLCFSVVIILFFTFSKSEKISMLLKIGLYLSLAVLIITIILLAGRIHIFLMILGIISYSIYYFGKRTSILKAISKTILIGLLITGLVFMFPTNRERFKQAINYKGEYGLSKEWGEQQMRPLMWSCALDVIKKAPLLGSGTGDVQDMLQNCYVERDYVSLLIWEPTRFNAHNQYLETTIGLGVVGLIIFVFSLIGSTVYAFHHGNKLLILFILVFGVSCLTESLLERQNGVVFFSFFNSLLLFSPIKYD